MAKARRGPEEEREPTIPPGHVHPPGTGPYREARRDAVMKFRRMGYSLRETARLLVEQDGFQRVSAKTVYKDETRRLQEEARDQVPKDLRGLRLSQLQGLLRIWWPRAHTDPRALNAWMKIAGRIDRILGLAGPKRIALSGDAEAPAIKVKVEEIERLPRDVDLSRLSFTELEQYQALLTKVSVDGDAAEEEPAGETGAEGAEEESPPADGTDAGVEPGE